MAAKTRGRPSPYYKLDLKKVKALALKSWTDKEMSSFFGVDISTWSRWKVDHPEFQEALKEWKVEADERVERSLFERAMGYRHKEDKIFNNNGEALVVPTVKEYPPDTTAMIFWLKNRQPARWRDKQELEHSGPNGSPVDNQMTIKFVGMDENDGS